ncbi:MAG: 16S rRNA (uracil(1498)-N(3))-methyltransferase [bacterium]|nr:16S rRNA (uracil(1498)-N(3))-methyltransferase [bacterium]
MKTSLVELTHSFWIHDENLRNQWLKVLRYKLGDQVVLFDGIASERLYKFVRIEPDAVQMELVTEFERNLPKRHVYMFFSLLKKDKNDWVLQKCTELGVRNFVPIIAERSEKTGFNIDRAEKIVIEAAEQCGRSDIPDVREPLPLATLLEEYKGKIQLLVCDQTLENDKQMSDDPVGIFVGPEGGWTEAELELFSSNSIGHLHLGNLTLRAETAAVAASTKLLQ